VAGGLLASLAGGTGEEEGRKGLLEEVAAGQRSASAMGSGACGGAEWGGGRGWASTPVCLCCGGMRGIGVGGAGWITGEG